MVLRFFAFALAAAALVFGCADIERDGPFDEKGTAYNGQRGDGSSSSAEGREPAPSSSSNGDIYNGSSSSANIMSYCVVGASCYEMSLYDCVNYYGGASVSACPASSSSSEATYTEFCLIDGSCFEVESSSNRNCVSYGGVPVSSCLASSSSAQSASSSSSAIATYALITNIPSGGGTVTRSPSSSSYEEGTIVTVTAAPNAGYRFAGWSGALVSSEQSVQVKMNENKILIAEFERLYTLTTNAAPAAGGTVTRSPSSSSYAEGTTVAVTAMPSTGYRFVRWSGASTSTNQSVIIAMDGNKTLTAEFELQTYTLTTSATSGGTVNGEMFTNATYTNGTTVTVTASASSGYRFVRWSGASTATTASVTITMDGNKTLTAEFAQITYTLTTSITPNGGGTVSRSPSSSSYAEGTVVTVTASASSGYKFVRWSGTSTETTTSVQITMDGNKTLTAEFEQITYTLTTSASSGGTVSKSPNLSSYTEGTTVTVTATPSSGYRFVGWSGASSSTSTSVSITMDENKSITANFEQLTYTLITSVTPTGSGTISRSPDLSSYTSGTSVTVTATPSTGYRFVRWSGASTSTSSSITITMSGDRTLTAGFFQESMISGTPVTYQGETYQTVKIGTQTWFARNLNYNVEGSKCYSNQDSYCTTYGRLYDWATAMALPSSCNSSTCASQVSAKHQGICPNGWHIPSDAECTTLTDYIGSSTAGTKLKATSGWNSSSDVPAGTDTYGFAALPGGLGYSGGSFGSVGKEGYWWSATEGLAYLVYGMLIGFYDYEFVLRNYDNKTNLFSVRCVKD